MFCYLYCIIGVCTSPEKCILDLVVANFRDKRFEVICPFKDTALVENDSLSVIAKFRKVFKAVHSRSTRIDIYDMPTVIGSVSNQTNQFSLPVLINIYVIFYYYISHSRKYILCLL